MSQASRQKYLKLALRAVASVFVFGFYPLTIVWPSGWIWHTGHSNYIEMMIALYATLGVFVFRAANDPEQNLSIISFTIWSSIVHGVLMAVQSIESAEHWGHVYGDVPALIASAIVISWLSPAAFKLPFTRASR